MPSDIYKHERTGQKVLSIISVFLLGITIYFVVHLYFLVSNESKQVVKQQLLSITSSGSLNISTEDLLYLQKNYPTKDDIIKNDSDSVYQRLNSYLKKLKQVNNLSSDIYIISFDSLSQNFVFLASSSESPYYMHPYERFPKELITMPDQNQFLDEYESENGTWLSATSPIFSDSGKLIGLLEADKEFFGFRSESRNVFFGNVFLLLIFFSAAFGMIFWLLRKSFKKEDAFKTQILDQSEEIRSQNEAISKANKELDLKVLEKTEELQTANEELSGFLYRSSHDILGPIASLKGLCDVALMHLKNTEVEDYLKKIKDTVFKLEIVSNRISQVYYLKNHKLQFTEVRVSEALDHVIQHHQPLKEACSIVKNNYFSEHDKIVSEPYLLELIIHELINNAFIHRPENLDEDYFVRVECDTSNNKVHLKFTNNGYTIPPGEENNIFRMFFKANNTSLGSGLGLFLVKKATKKLGGEVRFIREDQRLTTFELTIPTHYTEKELPQPA
ncbi:MAG: HAMP domain-containing sensor histidine kinase [Bacteroidota bacterium]